MFGIVKAPLHQVWGLFRPFGTENLEWWKIYETMEILPPGNDRVGCIRRFKLISQNTTFDELLVARDDENFSERYDFVQVEPPIPGLKAISTFVEFTPLTNPITRQEVFTKVRWYSYTDASPLSVKQALIAMQHKAYTGGILYLNKAFNPSGEPNTINLPQNLQAQSKERALKMLEKFQAVGQQIIKDVGKDSG